MEADRGDGAKPSLQPPLVAFGLVLLAVMACGGFQVRVTPTAAPPASESVTVAAPTAMLVEATPFPTLVLVASVTPTGMASATRAPQAQTSGLAPGAQARVAASGGVNVRDTASTAGKALGRLGAGVIVTVTGGPTQADNYTWWEIDDGAGLKGWVAAGTATDTWLVPHAAAATPAAATGPRLVNRPIQVGDRVQVTVDNTKLLTVRADAGTGATAVARTKPGTQFTVTGGPVEQDGLVWWQLQGETIEGWASEGQPDDRWLTPVEP